MNLSAISPRPPLAPRRDAQHGPDLIIDSVNPSDAFPMPGEAVWFDVTVKNQGDQDAGPFNVSLTSDGLDQKARFDAGLKAGASSTIPHMGPLNTDDGESFYWVDADADCDNEVNETRKDNNELMTSISVQQPPQPPPMPPIPPPPHGPHDECFIARH